MKYQKYGLVNTTDMFSDALAHHYAIGAFNFYNIETLSAVLGAARHTHSPIILAVSESALEYMGDDVLMAIIGAAHITPNERVALHLDHGHSFETCAHAIDLGFSSVMIDASNLPLDENIAMSARVAKYAHEHGVTTEAELGTLRGREDENTFSDNELYTNPSDVAEFVAISGVDSLAVAIGTSHGAYKMKSPTQELRFDILDKIMAAVPDFPLVLHGASSIPSQIVQIINENGGDIKNAHGIPTAQLQRATTTNICKINVDSDSRLAFTAAIRKNLRDAPDKFNPREYLGLAMQAVYDNTIDEITNIMGSANKLA
ncbi:MAG: ketose-bisphosphate aldolase [Alphaproteobacteria bacterium]|nr:ketose-bisphosphate aldolase [Alphaproteobacteria bacterium]